MKTSGNLINKIGMIVLALHLLPGGLNLSAQTVLLRPQASELHETYNLSPNGRVSVNNPSGNTVISSWDENRVRVDAVKRGKNKDEFSQIEIVVSSAPDRIEIKAIRAGQSGWRSGASVDFEIKVPKTADLNSIDSASGNIVITGPVLKVNARSASGNLTINGVSSNVFAQSSSGSIIAGQIDGDAVANTSSGSVKLTGVRGRATTRTSSGNIILDQIGGDIQAESFSDNITVTGAQGRLVANTLSGSILARNISEGAQARSVSGNVEIVDSKGRITANSTNGNVILTNLESREISAKTTSGNVRFTGRLLSDGHYEYESFNGDVVLILPADSSFLINTTSRSGAIKSEFQFQLDQIPQSTDRGLLSGTVGKGGAVIKASTFNGNVVLKKM
ncbi:MAG: DUF4097 family beta strand repeat protein [Acidobacteria bacterium]|nr:DUF4097 family beta strand repeat protein [Acidobacteriota bacterium]